MGSIADSLLGAGQEGSSGVNSFGGTSSVGSTRFDAATGQSTSTLSPEMQALFGQGVSQSGMFAGQVPGAGAQAQDLSAGFLSQAGEFDPFAAAQTQFDRLDAILEPGRQRQREGTAGGLLTTGRLGGSAGNLVQAQVEGEIEAQRQGLLSKQFLGAQQVQQGLVDRGTQTGAFGLQQQLGTQQLSQGALNSALGIDSQLQSQLALGSEMTKTAPIAATKSGAQELMGGMLQGGASMAMMGMI